MGKAALNPPAPNSSSGRTSSSHAYSNSIDKKGSVQDLRSPKSPPGQFATSPITSDRANNDRLGLAVDEFGSRKKGSDHGHSSFAAQTIGAIKLAADNAVVAPATGRGGSAASSETNSSPAARPRSSNGRSNTAQRLTIANMSEDEIREHMEAEAELARRQPSVIMESPIAIAPSENPLVASSPTVTPKSVTTTPAKTNSKPATSPLTQKWASAEDEKKRLYEHAVAKVERVQGRVLSTHEVCAPVSSLCRIAAHMYCRRLEVHSLAQAALCLLPLSLRPRPVSLQHNGRQPRKRRLVYTSRLKQLLPAPGASMLLPLLPSPSCRPELPCTLTLWQQSTSPSYPPLVLLAPQAPLSHQPRPRPRSVQ